MKFCLKKTKLWVHFINVFTRSFYVRRSQKCKKVLDLTVFFALLGSACVKTAHKHADEIDARLPTLNCFTELLY